MSLGPVRRWHGCLLGHAHPTTHGGKSARETLMWRNLLAFVRKRFGAQWDHAAATLRFGNGVAFWRASPGFISCQEFAEPINAWVQVFDNMHTGIQPDFALAAHISSTSADTNASAWRTEPCLADRERLVLFATDALTMLDYLERDEREAAR